MEVAGYAMAEKVTIDSPFKAKPSMSEAGFIKVLQDAGSPFVSEAPAIYHAIVAYEHDPARWLAISHHEHNHGTNPNSVIARNNTKSWTNARSVRHPDVKKTAKIITDSFRKSQYVKYASVLDSVLDGLYRVDEPTYAYKDAKTIKEVIAIWAPADDSNNPSGYARTVADLINRWSEQYPYERGTSVEKPQMITSLRSKNFGHDYAQNGGRVVEAIVNHIGQGTSASNMSYLTTGPVSCNYFIHENGTIYEFVPPEHSAWTNGDVNKPDMSNPLIAKWVNNGWNPNVRTITIEHGGYSKNNKGGSLNPAQWDATTRLQAWLCYKFNLPVDRTHILGHFQINGVDRPYCPGWSQQEWGTLLNNIRTFMDLERPQPQPEPVPVEPEPHRYFTETQHYLSLGFRAFWESYGDKAIPTFGYPLSEEFTGPEGYTVQWFERARFEHQPEIAGNPWGVVLGRVGAESMERDRNHDPAAFEPKPPPK